jgi:hypothetical protein
VVREGRPRARRSLRDGLNESYTCVTLACRDCYTYVTLAGVYTMYRGAGGLGPLRPLREDLLGTFRTERKKCPDGLEQLVWLKRTSYPFCDDYKIIITLYNYFVYDCYHLQSTVYVSVYINVYVIIHINKIIYESTSACCTYL